MQKENVILVIVIVGFLLAVSIIIFIAAMLVAYYKKELKFQRQFEEAESKFRQELLQSSLDIHEQTLRNIARDIHDNIGQYISVAKHCLNTMDQGDAEQKRLTAVDCLTKGLDDMRDLSKSLSLELIKTNGLTYAVENLIAQMGKITTFQIQFETIGTCDFMDEQREIFIFRILQEAISNVIRHATATKILVQMDCAADHALKLIVQDNGKGFERETVILSEGSYSTGGIGHMVNRVKLIEGQLRIESFPGKGTTVRITIPYPYKPNYVEAKDLYRAG